MNNENFSCPQNDLSKYRTGNHPQEIARSICDCLTFYLGKNTVTAAERDRYHALAYTVRDRLIDLWIKTQQRYLQQNVKRVYYMSMEFLLGRALGNALINLGLYDNTHQALHLLGQKLEDMRELEWDAGLGNGGLGRLAACFLDSMATLQIPAYGYGIRYEYGIFFQHLQDGWQLETPDNWLRYGNPWEIGRPEYLYPVRFYGRVEHTRDAKGHFRSSWKDTELVMAMAYDTPIPGYMNNTVNTLRLWAAKSTRAFNLEYFNSGDYIKAVEHKNNSEVISKVLYPNDNTMAGKELRLKQEYFFVAATIQDILRRFEEKNSDYNLLPEKAVIQLNDTHPALAIADLMRILVDEKRLPWERAWKITSSVFAYTNHTVLPEALEKWRVSLLEKLLPRHLEIIYEINSRFLAEVIKIYPGDVARLRRASIIDEYPVKSVQMAKLAVVGSFSVNGVSELHSQIIKDHVFNNFYELTPEKFNNKTNGITQRRWLVLANRRLADLLDETIGTGWETDLYKLKKLAPLADDPTLLQRLGQVKLDNKIEFAHYVQMLTGQKINPKSMFDFQVKRIHEYKRQLLNVMYTIYLYNQLRMRPNNQFVPRTIMFAGKAAPGYWMAKLIIKLINSVAEQINHDPVCHGRLKVLFLPNYSVSLAQKIFPASELSQQISTAGTEASGTGNMKFALNGALTIGTLDGANVEIKEEVGDENIFIFGLKTEEVQKLKQDGYNPWDYYHANPELSRVIDMIAEGAFSPGERGLFVPITDSLLNKGDRYCLLADFASYVECQQQVEEAYKNQALWQKMSILNTANCGKFSSDRTISEYVRDIWKVEPCK